MNCAALVRRFVRVERGSALVLALLCAMLMSALGAALVLATTAERLIADNFRSSGEALYAADGALERAIGDLQTITDWNVVLGGDQRSTFTDGAPSGTRTLSDGSSLDLTQRLNIADCGKSAACSSADMDAITNERPWGANNPRWQLFAYGALDALAADGSIRSPFYVLVLVADDQSEADDDPVHDSGSGPGAGAIAVRAEAFGRRGAHASAEATLQRGIVSGHAAVRVLSWREVR